MRAIHRFSLLGTALTLLALSACNFPVARPTRSEGGRDAPYTPPTLAIPPTSAPTPTLSQPTPAEPIDCQNNLRFVEDVTIPDGTSVQAGSALDKQWKVQNTGTCNWGEGYLLKLIEGLEMGAAPEQALFPARSGAETVLRIQFTAPADPGDYTSAWQAYDPDGAPFGDPFYIQITVQ